MNDFFFYQSLDQDAYKNQLRVEITMAGAKRSGLRARCCCGLDKKIKFVCA